MFIRSTTLSLAIAAASFLAYGAVSDEAGAAGRIIKVDSQDTSSHGGRIIKPSAQAKSTFGGRIIQVPANQADNDDGSVKIIRPRRLIVKNVLGDMTPSGIRQDRLDDHTGGADRSSNARRVQGRNRTVVINRFYGKPCFSGGNTRARAGDAFQAGGNMLRVPPQEVAYGRHACNKTRIYQRYLGFKRVYKGQVYTGFRKIYSGRRYLNGNY